MELPVKFKERMRALLAQEYESFELALDSEPVRALRVNTLKISEQDFLASVDFKVEKIPYVSGGYIFECDGIGNHALHHSGAIYVQEPAAMAVVEALDIGRDWRVLDVCAAPGGKSTQIAAKVTHGLLVSNEKVFSRTQILQQNIERLGVKNAVVMSVDSSELAHRFPCLFDMVLVDAPCSGEGMMRKNELAISEWSEENVKMCALRQNEILNNAAKTVRGGGYLLYSTCTFSIEENEMAVDRFLSEHPDFHITDVSKRIADVSCDGVTFEGCRCADISKARRFYPHKNRGEGQFLALMVRDGDEYIPMRDESVPARRQSDSDLRTVREFLSECLVKMPAESIEIRADGAYAVPCKEIGGRGVFSAGVKIGVLQKGRVVPSHRFFMAYGPVFKRRTDLAEHPDKLRKYLSGETFECDIENGYVVATYKGAVLGGVKVSSGVAKNHYPKGLRK